MLWKKNLTKSEERYIYKVFNLQIYAFDTANNYLI